MAELKGQAAPKLALLIDAENIRVEFLPVILREASLMGTITVRRVYGHFLAAGMQGWHTPVHEFALTPVHVPPRAKGKNAADMKLAIDAIDLLHQKHLQGFCIASSDSDFTTLANRIREDGLVVFGFGEEKATSPYVAACNRFFYCDLLLRTEQQQPARVDPGKGPKVPVDMIISAIEDASGEDGWAHLGQVGSILSKRQPDFDSRNYGFKKLKDLVSSIKSLELHSKKIGDGTANLIRKKP